jgi:hypothetical protein
VRALVSEGNALAQGTGMSAGTYYENEQCLEGSRQPQGQGGSSVLVTRSTTNHQVSDRGLFVVQTPPSVLQQIRTRRSVGVPVQLAPPSTHKLIQTGRQFRLSLVVRVLMDGHGPLGRRAPSCP